MFNDRSSILSLLETRRSAKPREMVEPGPSANQLEQILAIAARTPDHGKLNPWRFVTIARDQRDALAALLVEALAVEEPDATPAKIEKAHEFAHYAGSLVIVVFAPIEAHKIPIWEQELSCGAAAMNLLLATHALGFVGGWITGWAAYSPHVTSALCEPGERIAGFMFLASAGRDLEERPRAHLSTLVRAWTPDTR
jgi:nitroreductase